MKTLPIFLTLFLTCLCCSITHAQVHVDGEEDVGIGTSDTDYSKLKIVNDDNSYGLYLDSQVPGNGDDIFGMRSKLTVAGESGEIIGFYNTIQDDLISEEGIIGIHNYVYLSGSHNGVGLMNRILGASSGTGSKYCTFNVGVQPATSISDLYGTYHFLWNQGSGITYGVYNYLFNGAGAKLGTYNYINQTSGTEKAQGTVNYIDNYSSGESTGLDNYLTNQGTGNKYGVKNNVTENANSVGTTYGIYNQATLGGVQNAFGIWNKVEDATTSDGTKYGIYNYVADFTSNTTTKYGIYNYVEKQGMGTNYALWSEVQGEGDYAGYFSGNVVVTGTVIDGISDGRLKENVEKMEGALGLISQLQPKSYSFKKELGIKLPKGRQYGLVAQELEKIMPDLVSEFKHPGKPIYEKKVSKKTRMTPKDTEALLDGTLTTSPTMIEEDAGEEKEEKIVGYEKDQTYKAINYRALIPLLVGAVQEQQEQIKQLKSEVQSLKTRVSKLSGK